MGTEKFPKPVTSEDSTMALVARFRSGDHQVLHTLYSRYLAPFQRWVKCRTPAWASDSIRTENLVEKTLYQSLDNRKRERWSPRCFQSHLRWSILDCLEDELRLITPHRKGTAPSRSSALERVIGRRSYNRYESALRRLADEDREVIIARIELNFSYSKVAAVLGKSNPEEAREALIQALQRLAQEMGSSP